jgi:hypothetical protein
MITEKQPVAILFYLKTKGKKRGYIESPNTIIQQNMAMKYDVKWADESGFVSPALVSTQIPYQFSTNSLITSGDKKREDSGGSE